MKKLIKLAQLIDKASSKAFIARGKPFKEIAIKWRLIVGQTIWMKTIPHRITYKKFSKENSAGNLVIKSDPAFALELQHLQDKLIEKMAPKVSGLKIGPWDDPEAEMGPIVTRQSFDKITNLINEGEKDGADIIVDGRNLTLQGYEKGNFMGGTLFDNVKPGMSIYDQEIFGPVLSTVRAKSYSEALDLVKSNPYGNGVSIFTRDGDTARDFASKANIGMVGINIPIPVPVAYHSFGGWKDSLFGSNNAHGMDGVRFYTRIKTVSARWPSGIKDGAQFTMPIMK